MAGPSLSGGMLPLAVTDSAHLSPAGAPASPYRTHPQADSETTLNGNRVVLEDEMVRMGEARMNYDAAIGFYQKSLGLLRMAARRPGG